MLTIIQNDPEVPAGTYADRLRELGIDFRTVTPYTGMQLPSPVDLRAVIVLGGAMGVHDDEHHPFLGAVKRFIRACVTEGVPFLGICLGGQLLSHVLGGIVTPAARGEMGTLPVTLTDEGAADPLFKGVNRTFTTFQWHTDCFTVPPRGVHLAGSRFCTGQAFRYGGVAWGLQFHPEVTAEIVREWSLWTPETASRTEQFLEEFRNARTGYRDASLKILDNFLHIAGLV
jgi:GMP synthase-like glutamine amidotransferase